MTTTRSYNIFEFYSDCYLLKQVSYSTEVGGEILQLKGLNFTGNVAYTVQIGATKVSGLWDASSQAILTKSPRWLQEFIPSKFPRTSIIFMLQSFSTSYCLRESMFDQLNKVPIQLQFFMLERKTWSHRHFGRKKWK